METLNGSSWDVVVAGTGLQPALLALALSRTGKTILHLDSNDYYGGAEAALTVAEAEQWAQERNSPAFCDAPAHGIKPFSPKGYTLSLSPCLLHTRSALLPALVSSRAHEQLEFLAVGSWFVYSPATSSFMRVPNSREDIFSDASINLRTKSALVKFLRFVATYQDEEKVSQWEPYRDTPFVEFLALHFKIQPELQGPLLALTMTTEPSQQVQTEDALSRIHRHLTSMGVFGAGFSAVLPKYGGLSEVVQVACRAAAVGGAVYVLNRKIENVTADDTGEERRLNIALSESETVDAADLFTTDDQLPSALRAHTSATGLFVCSRSTTIIDSKLSSLFPPPSGNSPPPSVAVVVIPSGSLTFETTANEYPIHILVHSADTGECPQGHCVLYATTSQSLDTAGAVLDSAVAKLLNENDVDARVLWQIKYEVHSPAAAPGLEKVSGLEGAWRFVPPPAGPVFDDRVMNSVKTAWTKITHSEDDFLRFPDRNLPQDEPEDDDE